LVDVLHHDHARRRNARDVLPPIRPFNVPAPYHGRISRSNFAGRRIPDQGRKILEETSETGSCKPFISQPDTEGLNGVGYYARAEGPELVDLIGR
jgi:hypothetical protein